MENIRIKTESGRTSESEQRSSKHNKDWGLRITVRGESICLSKIKMRSHVKMSTWQIYVMSFCGRYKLETRLQEKCNFLNSKNYFRILILTPRIQQEYSEIIIKSLIYFWHVIRCILFQTAIAITIIDSLF